MQKRTEPICTAIGSWGYLVFDVGYAATAGDAGWNQPSPTAGPPTGAVTATPAPGRVNPDPARPKSTYLRDD